jgi:hypothetical protein
MRELRDVVSEAKLIPADGTPDIVAQIPELGCTESDWRQPEKYENSSHEVVPRSWMITESPRSKMNAQIILFHKRTIRNSGSAFVCQLNFDHVFVVSNRHSTEQQQQSISWTSSHHISKWRSGRHSGGGQYTTPVLVQQQHPHDSCATSRVVLRRPLAVPFDSSCFGVW